MVKLKIVFVWMLLIFTLNVDAETTCTRDYGGKIVLGECWYVKDGSYYKLAQLSDFTWEGGYEGYFLLDAYDLDEPFMIKIKPYFRIAGNTYTPADIHNTYPNYDMSEIINTVDNHKFGLNITQVPTVIQNNLEYVVFHLEDVYGVNWDDVELLGNGRIGLKDLILDYNDLKEEGYTINLYNKTTLLIGNVSGRETLFLDPSVILNATNVVKDTYVAGSAVNDNFDSDTSIKFDSRQPNYAYLRVNLTDLQGYTIDNARLHWYHNTYDYSGGEDDIGIHEVFNHSWEVETVTYNTQPCSGWDDGVQCNLTYSDIYGDDTLYTWHEFNITTPVRNQLGNGFVDLGVKQEVGNLYIAYYISTEWGAASHNWPHVDVDYSEIVTTTTTTTLASNCWDGLTDAGDFVLDDGSTCVITEDLTDAGGDIFVRGDSTLILEANLFFDEGNILLWEGGGKILLNGGFPIINLN